MTVTRRGVARLLYSTTLSAAFVAIGAAAWTSSADTSDPAPVSRALCGDGDRPETDVQGRVPRSDYDSGRAALGYTCNTRSVSNVPIGGGFKVFRYTDRAGRVCAYYDSGLLGGDGTVVVDMTRPTRPVVTTRLTAPAFKNPHESMELNAERGLLIATKGPNQADTQLDVYSVRNDCRHPKLLSSTAFDFGGHESGFASDGKTLYLANAQDRFDAVDLTDPKKPKIVFEMTGVNWHGMRVSDDGRTLYAAALTSTGLTALAGGEGLAIVDVSEIQRREPRPGARVLSRITWDNMSLPQVPLPFSANGHRYLFEVDEFAGNGATPGIANADVGAARIIDVDNPRRPFVVSAVRLEIHQDSAQTGDVLLDPGAVGMAQGYAAHYCSLPTRRDPKVVACSMIASGLRVFDISNVRRPREIAYFNEPAVGGPTHGGAWALSAPAWAPDRRAIWYSDINTGFHAVSLIRRGVVQ